MSGFSFGSTSNSKGLFGAPTSQPSAGGGLFGGSSTATTSAPSGGLFAGLGTTATSSAGGGGLFGNTQTATTGAAPSGGLFGALNNSSTNTATTTAPGGGLFSGLNNNNAAPASGGLFGQSTAKPASSGLFGQTTATTSAPAGNSFFGATTTTSAPAASSLFGTTSTAAAPSGGLQLGQSQQQNGLAQPQQGSQSTAYFDAILDKSRKRNYAQSTPDDLPQLQLGLGDLRSKIKRLAPGSVERGADGRAHYLLANSGVDPSAAIRDLKQFGHTGRVERVEQGAPETDVESYLANLQTQTTLSMIQDGLARSIQDFDTFLEDHITMEWDTQRQRIYQHFGITPRAGDDHARSSFAASNGASQAGFGRSRRSKAAAAASSRTNGAQSESKFGRSNMARSVIGAAGPVGSGAQPLFADVEKNMESHGVAVASPRDRTHREKESKYTDKVRSLNSARLQKRPFPVCNEFASVVVASGDHFSGELANAYSALIEIVGENAEVSSMSDPKVVKERQYASAYVDENERSVPHQALKKRILQGGARSLEKLKFREMEEFISKNPREANLGGIPNVLSKVKAYVRLQAARKNLAGDNVDLQEINSEYIWAIIFNLLRTGHVQEAAEYVSSNITAFRTIDRNFSTYLSEYANSSERRLEPQTQSRINAEYNQRHRNAPENSIDPYRMACYKIIGRCDLKVRQFEGISAVSLPDFMWLQLTLARESSRVDDNQHESYGLNEAQSLIREVGDRHFSSKSGAGDIGSSWSSFVLFLMVFGMFEEAVSYLYTYSYVDGVHLAIALDYYGLLRVSNPETAGDDFMGNTTRGKSQINFGRMLGYYTRDFRAADVGAAVDYLTLICLNKDLQDPLGSSQVQLCHEALRELVLESREYALLLGDIRPDGQRATGLIEERMALIGLDATDEFMRTITIHAASIADDNGRITDAVLLYHLAGEFDNVMTIVNRALSESVIVPIGHEQARLQILKPRADEQTQNQQQVQQTLSLTAIDDPVTLARSMRHVYERNNMFTSNIKDSNWLASMILLKLDTAKSLIEAQKWTEALDVSTTNLPPSPQPTNFCRTGYTISRYSPSPSERQCQHHS